MSLGISPIGVCSLGKAGPALPRNKYIAMRYREDTWVFSVSSQENNSVLCGVFRDLSQ